MVEVVDEYFRLATGLFFEEKCHEQLFHDFDIGGFVTNDCFAQCLSKVLGYGVVAGSVMVKVPQIKLMISNGSSEGVSYVSTFIDMIMALSTLAYGYYQNLPFSTYGDSIFLYAQVAIIAMLIPELKANKLGVVLTFCIVSALSYLTYFKLIPFEYVQLAQTANMPAVVVSRLIQAITNITNGHTKQLSFITVFLSFAGCAARVFTSMKDADDALLAQTFMVSTIANGVILFQVIYYSYMKKQKTD